METEDVLNKRQNLCDNLNSQTDAACFDPKFLSSCLNLLESSLKVIKREDLVLAGKDILNENACNEQVSQLNKEHSSSCLASLFSCLSIGAYVEKDQGEANRFAHYAESAIQNCQVAFLPTV